jgi:ribosomal protein L33
MFSSEIHLRVARGQTVLSPWARDNLARKYIRSKDSSKKEPCDKLTLQKFERRRNQHPTHSVTLSAERSQVCVLVDRAEVHSHWDTL